MFKSRLSAERWLGKFGMAEMRIGKETVEIMQTGNIINELKSCGRVFGLN